MIKAENLYKVYDTEPVLNNLDLHIKAGQFCMITGPSGTGKSTLLNVLSRLDVFQQGKLYLMGKEINKQGYTAVETADPANCIGCGACFYQCPEPGAITIYEIVED